MKTRGLKWGEGTNMFLSFNDLKSVLKVQPKKWFLRQ